MTKRGDDSAMVKRRRRALWATLCLFLVTVAPLVADSVRVQVELPVRAAIELQGRKSLALAPYIVVRQEGERSFRGTNLDVQNEFHRYLLKVLRRDTDLKITEIDSLDYPTYDLDALARDGSFWRAVGERYDVDLVLSGSIDFDVQDKSGYRLEEYVSPFDSRTYYRQVLVEETGFDFDILMQVYDGRTGELLHTDNFKDFSTMEGNDADPVVGMFQNLYAIEDRIVGVFVQKQVEAARFLLKP